MTKKMIINPDQEYVAQMREAIKKNNGFCPCIVSKTKDSICPCKDFRENKICHCELYVEKPLKIISYNGSDFDFIRFAKDGCYVCTIDGQKDLEIHFKPKDVKSVIYNL